jgi:hypothetical protein
VQIDDGSPELVELTRTALAELDEPVAAEAEATAYLAAGARPARSWSRLLLDAHEEGFAVAGGSIEVHRSGLLRGAPRELAPWKPGFGRSPGWELPLLCPSILTSAVPEPPWTDPVAGLPALDPEQLSEPWLCDGRIVVGVDARALRRDDRRSG